jgi:hypothetical protein
MAIEIEIVRQASMIAYNDTFFAIALVALAGAPVIFLMRRHRPSGSAP